MRRVLALLAVVAIVAAGLAIYASTESGRQKTVQLNQQIQGDVDQTVDAIKQLIQDNTQ